MLLFFFINAVLNVKRFVDNEKLVSSFLKEPMVCGFFLISAFTVAF